MSEPSPRVVVIGSINMDLVIKCKLLPSPGETVMGGSYRTYPGGKGANQAVAAARMGAHATLIGSVGDDANGVELHKILTKAGVDLTYVATRANTSTGLGMITVADGGENTIVVDPGANSTLTVEDVQRAAPAIEAADVLLFQLEVPLNAVAAAAQIARRAGKPVVLNAAPARPLPREILATVDVIVVNRVEAAMMSGLDQSTEPARLALRLAEGGTQAVVLTLGSQGAIVAYRNRPRRVRAFRVVAVDTVGAGDAFSATLAAAWPPVFAAFKAKRPEDESMAERALLMASAAGALATTKPGAIPSLPTRAEVEALMAAQPEESR